MTAMDREKFSTARNPPTHQSSHWKAAWVLYRTVLYEYRYVRYCMNREARASTYLATVERSTHRKWLWTMCRTESLSTLLLLFVCIQIILNRWFTNCCVFVLEVILGVGETSTGIQDIKDGGRRRQTITEGQCSVFCLGFAGVRLGSNMPVNIWLEGVE